MGGIGPPVAEEVNGKSVRHDIRRVTLVAIRRRTLIAVAALIATVLILYVSPAGGFGRAGIGTPFGRLGASATIPVGSRLEDIQARITPPAYAGGRTTTLDNPSSIAALTGSTIAIQGKGSATGVSASISSPVRVVGADGGWTVSLLMPVKPAALKLGDRSYERVIVLDPGA